MERWFSAEDWREANHFALLRSMQPGDAHEEQTIMVAVGYELAQHRDNSHLSLPEICQRLQEINPLFEATTHQDILFAEEGLLSSFAFFQLLPALARVLDYNPEPTITELNEHFKLRHKLQFSPRE
ncbi:hypothetical protein C5B42_04195 [Candidatus Cerribacteria bacterium 'Amazon FNV 2010 28 9']|uniref:Uncharacterized protein n=1 Tax=Candidatus Cerribacteria bacterium 'Amazon FNV 2010 28 9' TaxID=2081795 RepID=A0A317JN22_9BACT|nr:MAG: hypothetical protein C5B42_04195 [Candidatus Cerribacteria bacterium 'Amazon FNV 2010 28 9']